MQLKMPFVDPACKYILDNIRSALDAVWLACIFLAIISTFSMPLLVWGSNVLYPLGYTQVHSTLDVNI